MVVENQARLDSDCQQLNKQVEKQWQLAEKQLRRQRKTDFSCREDALTQLKRLAASWRYPTVVESQVIEQLHYGQSGHPKQGTIPTHTTYRVTATVVPD
ncbi:MAG: hypothetical protein AAGM36_17910 [Cyanobacteria bacterium J06597_1]